MSYIHSKLRQKYVCFTPVGYRNLKFLLCNSKLMVQSPTDVCMRCYDSASPSYNTRWLTWLECAKHPDHRDEKGLTLIIGDRHDVTEVLELPKSLAGCEPQQLAMCERIMQRRSCRDEYKCTKAHSIEEREYWKWTLIHKKLEKVTSFERDPLKPAINALWVYFRFQTTVP